MARVDVIMPQMGESIAEGTVSKWLKQVGDEIKRDEPILEISTDKVDAEIPSPSDGVIAEIKVPEGETIPFTTEGILEAMSRLELKVHELATPRASPIKIPVGAAIIELAAGLLANVTAHGLVITHWPNPSSDVSPQASCRWIG